MSLKIPENINKRITQVYSSFFFCNGAISELYYLNLESLEDEVDFINNHTFQWYKISLQYMFIVEYCKLLESGGRNSKENFASLFKLDDAVKQVVKDSHPFKKGNLENLILGIKNSDFANEMRILRDKKYAHCENSKLFSPLKIKLFSKNEIDEAIISLKSIIEIFNEITFVFDKTYDSEIPSRDNRTENFIRFQAKYKRNYFDNMRKI